ncbi:hypothetical protein KUTeg_013808 [Tegillarca granosa]|uniref:Uncharacterized protein n=1 Tax=Tegillarca granosa TaxID=220873 RepID=A0ABQ9EUS5_TEGGR|nr:hypothetical protein KUTeg_013808 [Tegillarca granosa]
MEIRTLDDTEKTGFLGEGDECCDEGGDHDDKNDNNDDDGDDDDDVVDLPTFDLGFNIDEDIIPPSPDMTTTNIIDYADEKDFQDDDKFSKDVSRNKFRERRKKEKSATVSNENKCQQKKFTSIKPKKSKSPADMFIVDEADVSDEEDVDISDDEADDSDLDNMEDSFIHEGSQLTQDCSEDMHAIYLKSVQSPAVSSGNRFKLKYDHGNIDVFSQAPRGEDEEESQYIDDSFCVDDDYEDTMIDIDEEVELCKDLNNTTFIGRRTRWSKPVRKETKKIIKTDKRMKRIRTMVDSSSDEETTRLGHVSNITSSQLLGCDYVVSYRMGVDRQQWAEFSNGANRSKLTEKIQHMCELYDRPCLLIEKDRIKGDVKSGSSRPLHWTKVSKRNSSHVGRVV